jgi:hypothetical protein
MTVKEVNNLDLRAARKHFQEGGNVTEYLRHQIGSDVNTPAIIEAAYDLQAGDYIKYAKENLSKLADYSAELAGILDMHINENDDILDVGAGELTTLTMIAKRLDIKPRRIHALDISWSRLYKGLSFADEFLGSGTSTLIPMVADINAIPLNDNSVEIATSSHALEPNGSQLTGLLSELMRVTSGKLVLFEPCYEICSKEGKARMDSLGYIKDLPGVVSKLGGKLLERIEIKNVDNPLNPTCCFVIEPPAGQRSKISSDHKHDYTFPGSNEKLVRKGEFYFSNQSGLMFPVIDGIPILKLDTAILASALIE